MEIFERVVIVIVAVSIGAWAGDYCIKNDYSISRSFVHGFFCGAISVIIIMISFYFLQILGMITFEMVRLVKGSIFILIFGVVVGAYSSYRVLAHDSI